MKCLNKLFKRCAWMITMLSVLGCSTNLFAMDTIKDAIASITSEASWDERIYELNDLFDEGSGTTLDTATQQSLAALITTVFNGRIDVYKSSMGTAVNLADLNLMLINAQKSPLLTTAQQAVTSGYQQLVMVEQLILQNQTEKNYSQQINNASSALGSAGASAFDPLIQSFFLQQLSAVYTGRTTQPEAIQERLSSVFTRAKTSTLIGDTNKADVTTKSDFLTTESSLRKATKDPVYASALTILTGLQTQDQTKKFEPFTQNLNFTILSQMFNTRDNRSAQEITGLIALLTQATTTAFLNAQQQAQIAAMLASLAIEKSLIDAMAKNSFSDKLTTLKAITSANANGKPSTNAQKLYSTAIQALSGARPANNLQANNDLITLFTSAQTTPLLADGDKTMIAGWLSTLQSETTNLAVQSGAAGSPDSAQGSNVAGLQNPNQLNITGLPGAGTITSAQNQSPLGGMPGMSNATVATAAQGSNTAGLKAPTQLGGMPGLQATGKAAGALGSALSGITGLQNPNQLDITGLPGAGTSTSGQNQSPLGGMPGMSNATVATAAQGSNTAGLKAPTKLGAMPGLQATGNAAGALAQNQQALVGLQAPVGLTGMPAGQGAAQQPQTGLVGTQVVAQVGQGTDTTEEQLIQEINQAIAHPELKDRLLGINAVLAKAGNRVFTGALQTVYAQSIQQLFDTREGNPAAQQAQTVAVSKAHKETVVAKASRQHAKSRKAKGTGKKVKKKGKKAAANNKAAQTTQPAATADPQAAHPASGKKSKKQRGAKK